jgi:hypothetical protein
MGYACPVCAVPQRDATHLADHLAFTAMLHGDDHEAWLDDHAPDWESSSPADLASVVAGHAPTAEYDEVFEDTVHGPDGSHSHDHDHDHGHGGTPEGVPGDGSLPTGVSGAAGDAPMDEETRAVLEEARAMTRQMYETDRSSDVDSTGEDDGSAGSGPAGEDDGSAERGLSGEGDSDAEPDAAGSDDEAPSESTEDGS